MHGWGEVMTRPHIDYGAVYRQLPAPFLLLTPGFVIADANEAFLQMAGRSREELLGRGVSDAFPRIPRIRWQRGCAARSRRCGSWLRASPTRWSCVSTTSR